MTEMMGLADIDIESLGTILKRKHKHEDRNK